MFYPSASASTHRSYESFNATHLVATPESLAYGLGGGLTMPLLNRAAIAAQYKSSNARQLQAVFNYEKILLQAFTDVANQLSMIDNLQKGYDLQSQQVDRLAQAVEISNILFRSARADYMEVLLTRRDYSRGAKIGAHRDEEAAVPGNRQRVPGARRGLAVGHVMVTVDSGAVPR